MVLLTVIHVQGAREVTNGLAGMSLEDGRATSPQSEEEGQNYAVLPLEEEPVLLDPLNAKVRS